MKVLSRILFALVLVLGFSLRSFAAPATTEKDLEVEKLKLQLERSDLEKEKLELQIEKLKMQAPAPTATAGPKTKDEKKAELEEKSKQEAQAAEQLAQDHKADSDLFVLDLANGDVWFQGARYRIYELNDLMKDQGWKVDRDLVTRKANGQGRFRYTVANLSMEKYEGEEFGVVDWKAPQQAGDYKFLIPGGFSFDSTQTEFRNNFLPPSFTYDREKHKKKDLILQYKRAKKWKWDDQLHFIFGPDNKLKEVQYGVMAEK